MQLLRQKHFWIYYMNWTSQLGPNTLQCPWDEELWVCARFIPGKVKKEIIYQFFCKREQDKCDCGQISAHLSQESCNRWPRVNWGSFVPGPSDKLIGRPECIADYLLLWLANASYLSAIPPIGIGGEKSFAWRNFRNFNRRTNLWRSTFRLIIWC